MQGNQTAATAGYGYPFYDSKKIKRSVQIGAGERKSKADPGKPAKGNAVGTAGMNDENAITATTRILDTFSVVGGAANAQMCNVLGVDVKMRIALALNAGWDLQRNPRPPAPRKPTDELTTVNVAYAF